MGFIADLSRYDPLEAVDLYPDGVILNIEDPGFAAKRDRAISKGIPWGTYSWVYPGNGADSAQRAHDAGTGALGAWLDYEQGGVTPADLAAALARGDLLGMKLGVYTYLYILPTVETMLGSHPLWLAYYPGNNDGTYQARYSDDARAHGALLHQFTSSNGTRDLSMVLDAARWSTWTGATPAPTPAPSQEDDDSMYPRIWTTGKDAWWLTYLSDSHGGRRVRRVLDAPEADRWKKEQLFGRVPNLFADDKLTPWVVSQAALDALPNVNV